MLLCNFTSKKNLYKNIFIIYYDLIITFIRLFYFINHYIINVK